MISFITVWCANNETFISLSIIIITDTNCINQDTSFNRTLKIEHYAKASDQACYLFLN